MGNRSIKFKLYMLSGFFILVLLTVSAVQLYSEKLISNLFDETSKVHIVAVRNMTLVDMIHEGVLGLVYKSLHIVSIESMTDKEKEKVEVKNEFKEFSIKINQYVESIDKLNIPNETRAALEEVKPVIKKYLNAANATIEYALSDQKQKAIEILPLTLSGFDELEKKLEDLGKKIISDSDKGREKGDIISQKTFSLNLILVAGAVLLTIVVSFWISKSLTKALSLFNDQLNNTSTQVSSASEELSKASEKLSSSSQQQASALEETSASLTEIAGMAESNIKNAEVADQTAQEVHKITEDVKSTMNSLALTMGSILESNTKIEKLAKVIEEVGQKTQIIDDIVFKTQLLSFNASVEAERAGEHGRGFSVVAQEVGNLAQLSGKAALEISSIVKESIKEADTVATENKSRVTEGEKLAKATQDKMGLVIERMNDILNEISKIVQASKEQGQGISQISTSVESISQMTQQTASTAEETASSSHELSAQSKTLIEVVNNLSVLVDGEVKTEIKNLP